MRLINKSILLLFIGASGCASWFPTSSPSIASKATEFANNSVSGDSYSILPMVGGLSMVGGLLLVCATFGRRGWLPLSLGLCLVVLNIFIMEYLHAIAVPVIVLSGLIGLAWTVKIIRDLLIGVNHDCKSDKSV